MEPRPPAAIMGLAATARAVEHSGLMLRRALFLLLLAVLPAAGAEPLPPNIVLIVSDDHAWTDYGFMGHPQVKTPHLDRLAARSLCYKRGYVTSSLCCPSLATILTGQYPHRHRITSNDPPPVPGTDTGKPRARNKEFYAGRETMNRFMDEAPSLPRLLGARGYLSLQTGKWWQGNFRRGGFTHGMTTGEPEKGGRHGDQGLEIGRKTMQPIFDFIATARTEKKPFFVWYAPLLPHDPHTPPQRLLDKYRDKTPSLHEARYWAMIEWFDETIGQLLDHLDANNLTRDTLIAYVADNGWIQSPDNPRYAPRSKQSQYDGGLRSPIMLSWPDHIAPAMPEAPASSIDLAPTLLRCAGVTPPETMSGLDLRDTAAIKARDAVQGACFTHNAVDLQRPASSLRWRWNVAGRWKLIVPGPNEPDAPVELYDILADPKELENKATAEPEAVAAMRSRLDAWWDGK